MIGIVIALFGALMIYGGIRERNKGQVLLQSGHKALAVIVSHHKKHSASGKTSVYYPIIRFTTDNKEVVEHQMQEGSNPAKPVGMEVAIVYNPDKPTEFSRDSSFDLKGRPYMLMAIGLAGIVGGVFMYLKK